MDLGIFESKVAGGFFGTIYGLAAGYGFWSFLSPTTTLGSIFVGSFSVLYLFITMMAFVSWFEPIEEKNNQTVFEATMKIEGI